MSARELIQQLHDALQDARDDVLTELVNCQTRAGYPQGNRRLAAQQDLAAQVTAAINAAAQWLQQPAQPAPLTDSQRDALVVNMMLHGKMDKRTALSACATALGDAIELALDIGDTKAADQYRAALTRTADALALPDASAVLRRWHTIGQALLDAGITPPADLMDATAALLGGDL